MKLYVWKFVRKVFIKQNEAISDKAEAIVIVLATFTVYQIENTFLLLHKYEKLNVSPSIIR